MTDRQREYLDAIRDLTRRMGYPPTFAEVGAALGGVSPAAVSLVVARLRRDGRVAFDRGKARTLRVIQ